MRIALAELPGPPHLNDPVRTFEALAAADRVGKHQLVGDTQDADCVLFPQCHMLSDVWLKDIAAHDAAQRHPEKVRVYDERDRPLARWPGLYVSLPSGQRDGRLHRAWAYATIPVFTAQSVDDPDLLFSFVGSRTHRCRRALLDLRHPDSVVIDATGIAFYDSGAPGYAAWRTRFEDVLGRSRFVLCPRGAGTSSIRMYEAMAAGKVPVIISDNWQPPIGPDWESCSLRWPEGPVSDLPRFLEDADARWPQLSAAAQETYAAFFARDVAFNRMAEELAAIPVPAPRPASGPRMANAAHVLPAVGVQRLRAAVGRVRPRRT